MARFEIKSKDGNSIRYSGKPRYNGSYLKPSFLEFSEIASSTPIQWEVGDYVDYPRTGMRYRLYSIPQPSKNARKGAVGNSFTYSNVQFFSATKELEIALFRDLVDNDNNIHFSTSPDVATFENIEGIIRRIQVCMNDLYPDRWEIRLASFDANEDAEVIERIAEPRDFALSGGTCLDALSKIYDLWDGIGWFHSHENGKEIITVGYANTRNAGNTTESYLYGKGNGLTAIKKHQTNKEEFGTRLYVYGSERNLPARYYNEKNILNAESVDIRNLMLPLDSWGKTDGLPDARKAYLENAEAVAKFGVIPKVHYFDSVDAGADIYPTIEGMTIGRLRKALDALGDLRYYPSASLYPDASKRVDEVRSCENPDDAGVINPEDLDKEEVSFVAKWGRTRKMSTGVVSDTAQIASFEFSIDEPTPGEVVVNPNVSGYIDDKGFDSVTVTLRFRDHSGSAPYNPTVRVSANKVGDKWEFMLPNIRYNYAGSPRTIYPVYLDFVIEAFGDSPEHASYILNDGTITYSLKPIQDETFVIQLDEIGFNIDEMALKGKGKTISMKTGSCAGRSFVIEETRRKGGYWNLICKRQQDNTLGLLFPNSAYGIAGGDRFVLLDIAMPETYVYAASDRLLAEGEKLLARASRIQNHYEPAIDAKVMIESGRTLREGMFMSIEDEDVVDNTTDYIIIDTLSIYEDESAIPTYRVTLRERRKVTYKGTPSATSSTDTQPVEKETNETTAPSFESFWEEDENGNVFTTRQIRIKNNLIVEGDTASGGNGDPGTVVGATSVVVDGVSYPAKDGVIDMTEAFAGLSIDVDLSDYYTKTEVNELIDGVTSGEIDLANYYTKSQVDDKFDAIDFSPYAKKTDVEGVETRVSTLEKAGYATKGYVDTSISALVNGAPSTLDTLKEIADAFEESQDVIDALDKAIGTKASQTALDATTERVGSLESTLKTEQGNIDTLEGYFASGIAKKATADAKGNVIDTYYTPIATHNAFKESTNASLALKASASDLSALAGRVTANEGSIASLQSGKADKATTLAGYGIKDAYTTTQVDEKISDLDESKADKTELEKYLLLEAEGQTIKGNIRIEGNLVVTGDTATGGEAGSVPVGITGILVDGMTYRDKNADGLVDITDAFEGLQEKIDLTNYYTRVEVDAQVDAINNEVSNKASQSDLDKVSGRVATLEKAGYATQTYVNTAISNLNIGQYATKTYVGEQITALNIGQYLKSATAESTYAKITSLTAVDNRLKGIEAYFATSEDAGTQIDKWNEIVAFLDATEGTTLAGILEAYTLKSVYEAFVSSTNTALADRYTKAQIDGKVTTINNSITSVDNKYASTKTWADTLASLIVNENGNIRIKTNLIVNGDTASGGGSGESAIGITGILLNGTTYRDENGDGIIDLGTITSGLTSVDWNDVNGRPTSLSQFNNDLGLGTLAYANGVTWAQVSSLLAGGDEFNIVPSGHNGVFSFNHRAKDGGSATITEYRMRNGGGSYAPVRASSFIAHGGTSSQFLKADGSLDSTSYLSTSGGTISGSLTLNECVLYFISGGKQYAYNVNTGNGEPIYLKNDAWHTLYHTGNFNPADYQEKNTGVEGGNGYVRIPTSSGGGAFIFYSGDYKWSITNEGWNGSRYLLHSGNIGDYALKLDGSNITPTTINANNNLNDYRYGYVTYKDAKNPTNSYGENAVVMALAGAKYNVTFQLAFDGNNDRLGYRRKSIQDTWSDWKTVAFTDSDITGNAAGLYGGTRSNKYYFEPWDYGYQLRGAYPILRFRNTNSQNSGIEFANNSDITRWSFSFRGQNNANEDFYFYKALEDGSVSPVMAFDYSSGNVGIGTKSSVYKLDVNGGISAQHVRISNGNQYCGLMPNNRVTGSGNADRLWLYNDGELALHGSSIELRNNTSILGNLTATGGATFGGNVLIGTADDSGQKLLVAGDIGLYNYTHLRAVFPDKTNVNIAGVNSSKQLVINSIGSTIPTIIHGGNVGIGTTSPAYKLDVAGSVRCTGGLTAGATTINGDVRINGNLIVTGDTASGGSAGTTTGGAQLLTLNNDIPMGTSVAQSTLDAIGLTSQVIDDLIDGKYHHMALHVNNWSGLFTISGDRSSSSRSLFFHYGAEQADTSITYFLHQYNGGNWEIIYREM